MLQLLDHFALALLVAAGARDAPQHDDPSIHDITPFSQGNFPLVTERSGPNGQETNAPEGEAVEETASGGIYHETDASPQGRPRSSSPALERLRCSEHAHPF